MPDHASLKDNVPIQDANSVALKVVQAAGDGGGVVLNFTPPEALKILQAAQQQGLQDRVKWACSTPCNTDFLADALGTQWDGKLGVNAELNLTDSTRRTRASTARCSKKYAPDIRAGQLQPDGLRRWRSDRHEALLEASRATATRSRASTRRSRT